MVHCWFISLTVHPGPFAPSQNVFIVRIGSAIIRFLLIQENCWKQAKDLCEDFAGHAELPPIAQVEDLLVIIDDGIQYINAFLPISLGGVDLNASIAFFCELGLVV
jgi:hypothetical protein